MTEPTTADRAAAIADAIGPTMLLGLQDAELFDEPGQERIRDWIKWIAKTVAALPAAAEPAADRAAVLREAAAFVGNDEGCTCAAAGDCFAPAGHYADCPDAVEAQPSPDLAAADDPTPLRWGLNDVMWGDDDTVTVILSGPDREPYWLELDPERAAVLQQDLAGPNSEAQPTSAEPDEEPRSEDVDPVCDPRAWETYRRDAGCGCTAPAPVDCKIPHGTGAWLCVCHRLSGPPVKDTNPRGTFLSSEDEAIRRHFLEPNRCLSVDGIFRCARPTGHPGRHRTGRTFWGRRAEDDQQPEPAAVEPPAEPAATETVHACPPDGSGLTPCCGRTPFELPLTDRMSSEAPTTCPGVEAQQDGETR